MTTDAQLALLPVFASGAEMIHKTAPHLHVTALDAKDLEELNADARETFKTLQSLAQFISDEKLRRVRRAEEDAEKYPSAYSTIKPEP